MMHFALESEVKDMLRYLHQVGVINYHMEPGLQDIVILDPQVKNELTRLLEWFS